MCRWIYAALVFAYVIVTIMMVLVVLIVVGVRIPDPVRWFVLVGWVVFCSGGVFVVEVLGAVVLRDCRRPIREEQERLVSLIGEVQQRVDLHRQIRFLIRGDAKAPNGSLGYRTILIQSGTLPLASDGELRGILAHELGHLKDGDRVMEAAFYTAGLLARLFHLGCRFIRRSFRVSAVAGLLLSGMLFLLLLGLLPFFLLDGVFRVFRWGLRRQIDYRQDGFAFKVGCGDGLRAWLARSGLAANASRIRRLEKMK